MASPLENWMIGLGFDPKGFTVVKHYKEEYNGNADLGDLFIVECNTFLKTIFHAGVCCDEEQIIHFTQSGSNSSGSLSSSTGSLMNFMGPSTSSSSSACPGVVSIVNVDTFTGRQKFAIYRKNDGIPASFKKKVKEAMKKNPKYDLLTYNCIHFAMELLDVQPTNEKP